MLNDINQIKDNQAFVKLALFASGTVGIKVAKFLTKIGNPPLCLVLDAKEGTEYKNLLSAAVPKDVTIMESSGLKEDQSINFLRQLELDLFILAWWPYILKSHLISIPKIGIINFHPSLLPYNRGKHYNFWTIVEESPFGVTLHWVNEGVDTGDIAFQREIAKTWEDTGKTLYHKAQDEIVALFVDSWPIIASKNIPRIPQTLDKGSYHHSCEMDAASEIKLSNSYTARELLNLLRARTFLPHPGSWFLDEEGNRYQIRIDIEKMSDGRSEQKELC